VAIEHDITVAVDRRGRTTPLGEFVFRIVDDRGMSVSQLSRDSNLSRSFLYLLKDDRQVPSLDTLVALFEAIGIDDVRPTEPGEPGELAIRVDDKPFWIRFPNSHRRTERSRAALQSFAASGSWADEEQPTLLAAAPQASYSRGSGSASGYTRSARNDERQRLLTELLAAAGNLDKERLALLLDHAKLLGRG
jgi:transcriptional regulator with XRE-family HTH domain